MIWRISVVDKNSRPCILLSWQDCAFAIVVSWGLFAAMITNVFAAGRSCKPGNQNCGFFLHDRRKWVWIRGPHSIWGGPNIGVRGFYVAVCEYIAGWLYIFIHTTPAQYRCRNHHMLRRVSVYIPMIPSLEHFLPSPC